MDKTYTDLCTEINALGLDKVEEMSILSYQLIHIAYKNQDEKQVANAYYLMARSFFYQQDMRQALSYGNRAFILAKRIDDYEIFVDAAYLLAHIYMRAFEYFNSITVLEKAIPVSINNRLISRTKKLIRTIIGALDEVGNQEHAEKYRKLYYSVSCKSLEQLIKSEDRQDVIFIYDLVIKDIMEGNMEEATYILENIDFSKNDSVIEDNRLLYTMIKFCFSCKTKDESKVEEYGEYLLLQKDDVFSKPELACMYAFFIRSYIQRKKYDVAKELLQSYWKYSQKKANKTSCEMALLEAQIMKENGEAGYVEAVKKVKEYVSSARKDSENESLTEFRNSENLFRQLSKTFELYREKEHWRRLANIDQLTGVYNRGGAEEKLKKLYLRREGNDFIFVIIFDVDNFKLINEQKGHRGGDNVLQLLARIILSEVQLCSQIGKENSVIYRFGGDEFVAVGYVKSKEVLESVMDHMKEEFKKKELSVSMGIAIARIDDYSVSDLYRHADKALYLVKTNKKGEYSFAF